MLAQTRIYTLPSRRISLRDLCFSFSFIAVVLIFHNWAVYDQSLRATHSFSGNYRASFYLYFALS